MGIDGDTPVGRAVEPKDLGRVVALPRVGGLMSGGWRDNAARQADEVLAITALQKSRRRCSPRTSCISTVDANSRRAVTCGEGDELARLRREL